MLAGYGGGYRKFISAYLVSMLCHSTRKSMASDWQFRVPDRVSVNPTSRDGSILDKMKAGKHLNRERVP